MTPTSIAQLWHKSCGNLHYGQGLKDLFRQGKVVGMPRIEHVDEVCGVGKQHINRFPSQSE